MPDRVARNPASTAIRALWSRLSLANRFAAAGGVVLVISALLIGSWVARRIESSVVRSTAGATALYMDSVISPLTQDLAQDGGLSPGAQRALHEIFDDTPLGERVVSFKIRDRTGQIVAATDPALVGQTFEPTADLEAALQGQVRATYERLDEDENRGERALGLPLLEIYSPIRADWTGEVIGVAEFYEVATDLANDLGNARRNTWLAVGLVLAAIGSALYAIVLQGSRMIGRQQALLGRQVIEMRQMSERNAALRQRVQEAASRASTLNDRVLRQIGADLHDGPAQLMAYAALRLDELPSTPDAAPAVEAVRTSIADAIHDIRQISRGLSLPDIDARSPCQILTGVAEAHAARTGTRVEVDCALDGAEPDPAQKICLYRFAQEGLTNAFRHGGGDARLTAARDGRDIVVAVEDRGPGLAGAPGDGMGLAGLRDRVESLGGTLTIANRTDGPGARIEMRLEP